MSTEKDLIKKGSLLTISSGIASVLALVFVVIMRKESLLGKSGYAYLGPIMALLTIIGIPLDSIRTATVSFLSKSKANENYEEAAGIYKYLVSRMLVIGIIILVIFISLSPLLNNHWLQYSSITPLIILALIMFTACVLPIMMGTLQAMHHFNWIALSQIVGPALKVVFPVAFIMLFGLPKLSSAMSGILILNLSFFVVFYIPIKKELPIDKAKPVVPEFTPDFIKYLKPTLVGMLSFAIMTSTDQIIVRKFMSPENVESYSTAAGIIGRIFLYISGPLVMVLLPTVAHAKELNKATHKSLILCLLVTGFFALCGIIFCWFFPEFIIKTLFGPEKITPLDIDVIKKISVAITPYGLIFILLNYNLAKHKFRSIILVAIAAVLQVFLLLIFHENLNQVMLIVGGTGYAALLASMIETYSRKHISQLSGSDSVSNQ